MKPTHRDRKTMLRLLALLLAAALLGGCGTPAAVIEPAETEPPAAATPAPERDTEAAETEPPIRTHAAFLFPDEDGFLRPDEPIAADELRQALDALEGADTAGLQDIAAGSMSRRDFARRAAGILGRTEAETVTPAEGAAAPVDLDPADPDYALLLEASIPHTAGGEGTDWSAAPLAAGHEPGPFLRGCELYCCGEDGLLLRGEKLGPLFFGEDGRFTSGDAELDGYVTEVIVSLQEQYPEDATDRFLMLRHCYDYVRDSFSYLGRRHIIEEGTDWSAEDAKQIFSTGKGNCYNYAAAFRALARRLGYPAYVILRSLDDPENVHAWTDIVFDGVPYVFDPQLEQVYKNARFMLSYQEAQQYGRYSRPEQEELEAGG